MASTALVRPRRGRGRVLGGVCAALARRFGTTPWRVRALFILSCLLPGPQFLLYLGFSQDKPKRCNGTRWAALRAATRRREGDRAPVCGLLRWGGCSRG